MLAGMENINETGICMLCWFIAQLLHATIKLAPPPDRLLAQRRIQTTPQPSSRSSWHRRPLRSTYPGEFLEFLLHQLPCFLRTLHRNQFRVYVSRWVRCQFRSLHCLQNHQPLAFQTQVAHRKILNQNEDEECDDKLRHQLTSTVIRIIFVLQRQTVFKNLQRVLRLLHHNGVKIFNDFCKLKPFNLMNHFKLSSLTFQNDCSVDGEDPADGEQCHQNLFSKQHFAVD